MTIKSDNSELSMLRAQRASLEARLKQERSERAFVWEQMREHIARAQDAEHSLLMLKITRWEHEHLLEAVQRRLDGHPEKMRQRRETVEHPFGTIKSWMGATHFQMRTLKRVATEMALHVLAYNLKRAMSIMGVNPLIAATRA